MALGENEGMNTTMLVSPANALPQAAYGGMGGMGLGSDWGTGILIRKRQWVNRGNLLDLLWVM